MPDECANHVAGHADGHAALNQLAHHRATHREGFTPVDALKSLLVRREFSREFGSDAPNIDAKFTQSGGGARMYVNFGGAKWCQELIDRSDAPNIAAKFTQTEPSTQCSGTSPR